MWLNKLTLFDSGKFEIYKDDEISNLDGFGLVGGAATAFVNAYTIGTTAGRQYPTTKAGGALAWEDVGTSDVRMNVTNSAGTNAGEVRLTVLYQQNTNLA